MLMLYSKQFSHICLQGSEENFHLKFLLSEVDVSVTGVASNTLTIPEIDGVGVTITPATDPKKGLIAGQSLTISGTVAVTVPTNDCTKVRFVCANSMPTTNAYDETSSKTLNNWKCKDISIQISCAIGEYRISNCLDEQNRRFAGRSSFF